MLRQHSNKNTPSPFAVHDEVLVHKAAFRTNHSIPDINKFDDRWHGPFIITHVVNPNAFRLALPPTFRKHNVINISFLRPYHRSSLFPREHPDDNSPPAIPLPDSSSSPPDSIPEYEVESILKLRLLRSHPHYRSNLTTRQQLTITTNPHHYEFLVKWLGYHNHDNTWEPYDNLTNAPSRLNEFIHQHYLPHIGKSTRFQSPAPLNPYNPPNTPPTLVTHQVPLPNPPHISNLTYWTQLPPTNSSHKFIPIHYFPT